MIRTVPFRWVSPLLCVVSIALLPWGAAAQVPALEPWRPGVAEAALVAHAANGPWASALQEAPNRVASSEVVTPAILGSGLGFVAGMLAAAAVHDLVDCCRGDFDHLETYLAMALAGGTLGTAAVVDARVPEVGLPRALVAATIGIVGGVAGGVGGAMTAGVLGMVGGFAAGQGLAAAWVLPLLPGPSPPPPATLSHLVYTCPGDYRFSARFLAGHATVTLSGRQHVLLQVPAASGVRYAAEGLVLWTKGREARLELGTATYTACAGTPAAGPWEEAALLGATFRAVGQEPGWSLAIHPDRLVFVGDYGVLVAVTPTPDAVADSEGGRRYDARTEAHILSVVIEGGLCVDTMSGEGFAYAVRVELDGRVLHGCGRALAPEQGQRLAP